MCFRFSIEEDRRPQLVPCRISSLRPDLHGGWARRGAEGEQRGRCLFCLSLSLSRKKQGNALPQSQRATQEQENTFTVV